MNLNLTALSSQCICILIRMFVNPFHRKQLYECICYLYVAIEIGLLALPQLNGLKWVWKGVLTLNTHHLKEKERKIKRSQHINLKYRLIGSNSHNICISTPSTSIANTAIAATTKATKQIDIN